MLEATKTAANAPRSPLTQRRSHRKPWPKPRRPQPPKPRHRQRALGTCLQLLMASSRAAWRARRVWIHPSRPKRRPCCRRLQVPLSRRKVSTPLQAPPAACSQAPARAAARLPTRIRAFKASEGSGPLYPIRADPADFFVSRT